MRRTVWTVLILLTIGTFVSAQQVSSEPAGDERSETESEPPCGSVFTTADAGMLDLQALASAVPPRPSAGMSYARADTVETYDIQVPSASEGRLNAKTIAALVVIGLFVGVALYVLIGSDEETTVEDDNGKPLPDYSRGFSVPLP